MYGTFKQSSIDSRRWLDTVSWQGLAAYRIFIVSDKEMKSKFLLKILFRPFYLNNGGNFGIITFIIDKYCDIWHISGSMFVRNECLVHRLSFFIIGSRHSMFYISVL